MILETFLYKFFNDKYNDNDATKRKNNVLKINIIIVLKIALMTLVAYLAWDCNKNTNIFLRIIYTLLAFVFSIFYLLYYTFYRLILKNKCYSDSVEVIEIVEPIAENEIIKGDAVEKLSEPIAEPVKPVKVENDQLSELDV